MGAAPVILLDPSSLDVAAARRQAPSAPARRGAPLKFLLYSHDTVGLGNIRRTLLLAELLASEFPGSATLLLTGSPAIQAFRLPGGLDYIKLPTMDRPEAECARPRYLSQVAGEVQRARSAILTQVAREFAPDLLIVDKRPSGIGDELLGALCALRAVRGPRRGPGTRIVLGVRDILDDPARTRAAWQRAGHFDTIARYYDEVWVYGDRSVFDAVAEYDFPEEVARKTVFCGYLERPVAARAAPNGAPSVLVTAGGGGDGRPMIEAYLGGLAELPRRVALRSTVIFGPEMPEDDQRALRSRYGSLGDVTFEAFDADLTKRYAEHDVVVAMAGYNTVCELLSCGARAVLVPRAEPVREQLIRARLLSARGYCDMVEPAALAPDTLIRAVLGALERAPAAAPPFALGGLPRVRDRVRHLLGASGH